MSPRVLRPIGLGSLRPIGSRNCSEQALGFSTGTLHGQRQGQGQRQRQGQRQGQGQERQGHRQRQGWGQRQGQRQLKILKDSKN